MVKEIRIVVHPSTGGFFLVGSVVSGEVVITTGSKKSDYSKVEVTLCGTIESDFTDSEHNTRCSHSEEIVKSVVIVWEKTEASEKFPKGQSRLPFSIAIPNSSGFLPSCDNNLTTVQYSLSAAIIKNNKRSKTDSGASTKIKIYPPVNVSDPNLQNPQSAQNVTPFKSCCCLSGGSIESEIRVPHKGYRVEELVGFEVEIDNGTRKRLPYFDAGLIQTITCGGTPRSRFGRRNLAIMYGEQRSLIGSRTTGQSVLARNSWVENLAIRIPETIPPSFESSDSILTIEYHIVVRVHTSRNARDSITFECPVVIGNCNSHDFPNNNYMQQGTPVLGVPPSAPVPDNYGQQVPSGFSDIASDPPSYFDIANPAGSSAIPSAPTLPQDEL